jgi:hypothetical protein
LDVALGRHAYTGMLDENLHGLYRALRYILEVKVHYRQVKFIE